jgi:hypothetical protein
MRHRAQKGKGHIALFLFSNQDRHKLLVFYMKSTKIIYIKFS